MAPVPIPGSYWAQPALLLAGPILVATDGARLRAQHSALVRHGKWTVLELHAVDDAARSGAVAAALGDDALLTDWVAIPVIGRERCSTSLVELALDLIDSAVLRDRLIYLGSASERGVGGTIVACWWIRHGVCDAEEAVAMLAARRAVARIPSHENAAERRLIQSWSRRR